MINLFKTKEKPIVEYYNDIDIAKQRISSLHRRIAILNNKLNANPDDPETVESIRVLSDELERVQRKYSGLLKNKVHAN